MSGHYEEAAAEAAADRATRGGRPYIAAMGGDELLAAFEWIVRSGTDMHWMTAKRLREELQARLRACALGIVRRGGDCRDEE